MKDYLKFYNELNLRQKEVVDRTEGALLVLAGPGTGKTLALSVRAGSILKKKHVRPDNILILTYTNSAAKAMKERLSEVIGLDGYEVEVGTFHSFANSIIQGSEEAAIYIGDKVQMDDVERMRVIEYILDNTKGLDAIRPFRAPYTYLKEILQRIGDLKKDGVLPQDFENYLKGPKSQYRILDDKYKDRLGALAIVYKRYEELKEGKNKDVFDERGRYDFDDMILFAIEVLRKENAVKKEYRDQYKYVMVDEFQDTNGAQAELLFELLDYKNPNLLCVGDDDQSIYRFQGASVGNFKLLSKKFPQIETIYLKDNYRSAKELIDVSSKIISMIPAKERMPGKTLEAARDYRDKEIMFREFTTEAEELIYIVDKVKELKDVIAQDLTLTEEERKHPYNNIAVLVRKRNDILKVIDAFLQAGIPYATDGKEDISGEKRVKQLLDILDLAHIDPAEHEGKDLALYKVLTADYLEIPHVDVLRFLSYANFTRKKNADNSTVLEEFLSYFQNAKSDIKLEAPEKMRRAALIIGRLLEDARTRSVHSILMEFMKDAGVFKFIIKSYDKNQILRMRGLRSLTSFVNMVKTGDMAKPGMRLDDFSLDLKTRKDHGLPIQGSLVTMTQEGVRIYTAHGSKGLEFQTVLIPFCLHNKNWPARPIPDKIHLPFDLFKTRQDQQEKQALKELALHDETRLFYVAATRAKSNLIFTSSPTEGSVSSQYLNELDIHKDSPEYVDEEELISKSIESTDLSDPFIGTEEILKDMVDTLTLNPTRLNTYITCKRKFLYNDALKLPGAKKKSLVFGNCVHKALEEVYKEFMKTEKFPLFLFFKNSFTKELRFQGVDKAINRDCLNKAETLKDWFRMLAKNPVMPIGLERKLVITVGDNIIFTGKYDKVEWADEKKGLVRIVDYKTGKPDDHLKDIEGVPDIQNPDCDGYLRQLVCYKLLFEKDRKESKGRRASHGVLVFAEPVNADIRKLGYKKGQYVTKSVLIGDEIVATLEELIKKVWAQIKALRFEKLPERDVDKCGRCDFNTFCWE
ncbi:MAG: ATP-dependent DNA helicase [Candidatus Omnitrophica bacterium]|nr:ATP-dependent DNA helicase [Candidatus Omnitrophota bacterium]